MESRAYLKLLRDVVKGDGPDISPQSIFLHCTVLISNPRMTVANSDQP